MNDANGSMTADESGRIFVYDAWNRLAAVRNTANSPIVGYSYDALGRRIIEDRPNANTVDHLYYSTSWQVLEERRDGTSTGDVRRQYFWGIDYVDALTARVDYASGAVSATYYAQYDANWNITAIVDATSGVLERYIYDPYGTATVLYAMGKRGQGKRGHSTFLLTLCHSDAIICPCQEHQEPQQRITVIMSSTVGTGGPRCFMTPKTTNRSSN